MIQGFFWIVMSYGLGIALVHLYSGWHHGDRQQRTTRYILITKNNQAHIEWYIRYLWFFSWLRSKQINITIVDEGSHDETIAILQRLTPHRTIEIRPIHATETTDQILTDYLQDQVIVVRISNMEHLTDIPLPF